MNALAKHRFIERFCPEFWTNRWVFGTCLKSPEILGLFIFDRILAQGFCMQSIVQVFDFRKN